MGKERIHTINGVRTRVCRLALVVCCAASVVPVLASEKADQPITWNPHTVVDFRTSVIAVHEVPAGKPMPGLHLEVKVKGRTADIYVAPMNFIDKYEVKVLAGEEVHVVGSQTRLGDTDVVLAREITVGESSGTLYLRDDNGPFWSETETPNPQQHQK